MVTAVIWLKGLCILKSDDYSLFLQKLIGILLRILPLAFDKISAPYFTPPFTVKYFADDAIPSSLNPRVCFTCQVPDPRLSAMNMQSSQGRYFCSCISSANAMHNAIPARALRSCHTLPPRGLEPSFGNFPSTFLGVQPYTPNTVRGWCTAKQSPWLTRSVISDVNNKPTPFIWLSQQSLCPPIILLTDNSGNATISWTRSAYTFRDAFAKLSNRLLFMNSNTHLQKSSLLLGFDSNDVGKDTHNLHSSRYCAIHHIERTEYEMWLWPNKINNG